MYAEARKLHLIEGVLNIKSDATLTALEDVLKKNAVKPDHTIYDFAGILTDKEANTMKDAIAEACETIDEND
jgi:hypothetical protein